MKTSGSNVLAGSLIWAAGIAANAMWSAGCTITTSDTSDAGAQANAAGAAGSPTPDAGDTTTGLEAGGGDATVVGNAEASTGSGPLGFAPSNLGDALAGLDLSKVEDIDISSASDQLDTGSLSCAGRGMTNSACVTKTLTQSDGSTVALYIAKSWKIEPAAVLAITGQHPVIIIATTTMTILGRIDLSASNFATVAGGFRGMVASAGAGPGGGGIGSNTGTGIGGGGGSFCGLGGTGGGATAMQGSAGKTYGMPTIIPLAGGSSGGSPDLFPGAGGGAMQLVAGTSITVGPNGVISTNGGGGDTGGVGSGSGGGSGGALLLEAPSVTVAGLLSANGGGGGGNGAGTPNGADGSRSATPAPGGNATRDPGGQGTAGGNGSAAGVTAGTSGDVGNANYTAAGGGGGAGYIRINTQSGAASVTGTVSPAMGTCASQGTLAQ